MPIPVASWAAEKLPAWLILLLAVIAAPAAVTNLIMERNDRGESNHDLLMIRVSALEAAVSETSHSILQLERAVREKFDTLNDEMDDKLLSKVDNAAAMERMIEVNRRLDEINRHLEAIDARANGMMTTADRYGRSKGP
jgi:hypothetical protein